MPKLSYDEILNTECLFCSQAKTRDRIRVRRDRSDADFHLSIVNDQMFGLMMNNRGRLQFPCMLISLVFDIPFEDLIKKAEFYKEFIDKEKLQAKGEIADCMIIYKDSIFNIEMNGTHTLARNQDYIHKASIIQNKRGKRKFHRRDYYQINLNNFRVDGHDEVFEVYQPLDKEGDLYGYQTFVNVFLLNLRDKYYTKSIKSLDECEKYIMGLVETSWKRTNELAEGSEILMEYKEELEAIEYIDLPDPVDKVAEEIEIELENAYEDGLENGLKKGHKTGVEEGSKRTLMAIVKNMQNAGRTLKEISDTICVPLKDIQKLCVNDK